ncbi:MAG: serine hydrolase domain-containing protein [Flavisolibacter sp.]
MRKFALVFLVLSCFLSFFVSAQVIEKGKTNPNVDYAKLARIDTLIDSYVKNDWLKGVVTLIVKDNQLVQYKGYGYADAATKKSMPADALFRIASQTKAITSVGIMILYEQGKLLLDEPLGDFIQEFKNEVVLDKFNAADTTYTTVPARRNITIRDLLTHSSGIDYPGIGSANMRAIYAKAGIPSGLGDFHTELLTQMKKLGRLPLAFQPGERFQYGLNTDLLGCIIEVISGQPLEEFFRKNIFEPLEMNDTYFNVPAAKASRLAVVYTEDADHHIIALNPDAGVDPGYPIKDKHYFSGGAGLSSTAFDYAVFLQMLLNGGIYNGKRILSPRTVEMMTSNQLDFHFNGINDFGLGFEIVTDKAANLGPKNKGSFSWGGYFGTTYWADPKEKMICLIMTQQTPNSHGDIVIRLTNMIYASLKK